MGEHKAEVIVKRYHSCLRAENLVPCGGNVDGACRYRNLQGEVPDERRLDVCQEIGHG
jgi:hypothetical protein